MYVTYVWHINNSQTTQKTVILWEIAITFEHESIRHMSKKTGASDTTKQAYNNCMQ